MVVEALENNTHLETLTLLVSSIYNLNVYLFSWCLCRQTFSDIRKPAIMAIFKMLSTNTSLKRLQIVEKVFSFAFRDIIWHEKDMKQIQEWLQNNFTIESLGVPVSPSTILPILCYFLSDKTHNAAHFFWIFRWYPRTKQKAQTREKI